jgi:dTDP-4-dehydrorhamnose 3,5-epimerase
MNIITTPFNDLFVIEYASFKDNRGEFVKTIHDKNFSDAGLDYHFAESFYSISNKNVIRGMHYQIQPSDHHKLVYVVSGGIIDVVVDLRWNSETFGKFFSVELSDQNRKGIYISKGFAHGFLALNDNTIVEYHTSTSQSKAHEEGIRWDSFGFEWNVSEPILSYRDQQFNLFDQNRQYFI